MKFYITRETRDVPHFLHPTFINHLHIKKKSILKITKINIIKSAWSGFIHLQLFVKEEEVKSSGSDALMEVIVTINCRSFGC